MGRRASDIARKYCTAIDNNSNHLRCKFCGHTMWGITRFKEHLAHKRGDVMPCGACPGEVTVEMTEELIQLSLKREEKERITREELQSMINNISPSSSSNVQQRLAAAADAPSNVQERPAAAETELAQLEAKERAFMEEAIKESMKTFEMEKSNAARYEDDELEAAIRESMKSFKEDRWRSGESSGRGGAGPSSFDSDDLVDVGSDYDSDLGF
ncbi:Zinc finger protein [Melia azedarach]|uniref:Zinc finger protein n=1 Tax=Melia azedarach TaxID=155640 RepID=A0ACC1XDB1_MELAZ|nr:Zinc finger protein [Melia azedarach]